MTDPMTNPPTLYYRNDGGIFKAARLKQTTGRIGKKRRSTSGSVTPPPSTVAKVSAEDRRGNANTDPTGATSGSTMEAAGGSSGSVEGESGGEGAVYMSEELDERLSLIEVRRGSGSGPGSGTGTGTGSGTRGQGHNPQGSTHRTTTPAHHRGP